MKGIEDKPFIQCKGVKGVGPKAILELVRGEVTRLEERKVLFGDGKEIEYGYLAIATGTQQLSPARLTSLDKEGGCQELRICRASLRKPTRWLCLEAVQ